MKKQQRLLPRTKFLLRTVLYAVCMIFCLFRIQVLWQFALIFLLLTALNIYFAYKHWNDDVNPLVNMAMEKLDTYRSERKRNSRQGRKEQYAEYIQQVEDDFDFDDYDDEDDEDEEDVQMKKHI